MHTHYMDGLSKFQGVRGIYDLFSWQILASQNLSMLLTPKVSAVSECWSLKPISEFAIEKVIFWRKSEEPYM